jgi:hypothetical protein
MQSKIAIHVYYALYLQYMFVIYLFYYAFTLTWPFYIKINMLSASNSLTQRKNHVKFTKKICELKIHANFGEF